MAFLSAWLIGSYASLPQQALTVNASPQTVPAGNYYLRDSAAALSLLEKVKAAMTTAGVGAASAVLTQDRRVKLSGGANFSITWTDTLLRNLLGFSQGNLAGAASYVAASISPLLWSPGRPESPMLAPLGVRGAKVHTVYQAVSPYSGLTQSVSHGYREYNRFMFANIDVDRVRTATDEGGTFACWFENVAVPSARWKLYRNVSETPGSTATATLSAPLGPYIYSAQGKGPTWSYNRSRGFEWVDQCADIDISCHVTEDFSS
jgi:hypothetical protein